MTENPSEERIPPRPPGELIREALAARNWTQADLAKILNRPLPTVNEIIQGKRAIMPEMAIALGMAFGEPAETWMHREGTYRLSLAKDTDALLVRKRARLYEVAPVKEIQKRGWIRQTDDVVELEAELKRFFAVDDLDVDPKIIADFRKSSPADEFTPSHRAWCARALHLARALKVSDFRPEKLAECEVKFRRLAAYSQEAKKVPALLASYGVRFIVIEPLQGSKIDGAAMWLNEESPVIALSIRYDRIDSFWFTLGHEFSHIRHRDAVSVDTDIAGEGGPKPGRAPVEERADQEAAAMLIPPDQMQSFILRVGPMYSKERINQFANRVKIHPGIIVGQLHNRKEIRFSANREMLVKVRSFVVTSAVTDGWSHSIDPKVV